MDRERQPHPDDDPPVDPDGPDLRDAADDFEDELRAATEGRDDGEAGA